MRTIKELGSVNLNLLPPLNALLKYRNVSAAAESLGVTQSTMSRNLSLLRSLLDDPLLVRAGHGYVLTPRSQQIKVSLNNILLDVSSLFNSEFDPTRSHEEFRIAVPDYVSLYVLPDVLAGLLSPEFGFRVFLVNWDVFARDLLLSGDLHLAVSLDDRFPDNIYRRIIDEDRWVVVMNRKNPVLEGEEKLTPEGFDTLEFAEVSTGGGRCKLVDCWLEKQGLQRKIRVTVPAYDTAFAMTATTSLAVVCPGHVARNSRFARDLHISPFPYEIPMVRFSVWWHERFHKDEAHRWLRNELLPKLLTHPNQLGISRPE